MRSRWQECWCRRSRSGGESTNTSSSQECCKDWLALKFHLLLIRDNLCNSVMKWESCRKVTSKYINHLGKIGSSRWDQWLQLKMRTLMSRYSVELVFRRHPTSCLENRVSSFLRRIRKPVKWPHDLTLLSMCETWQCFHSSILITLFQQYFEQNSPWYTSRRYQKRLISTLYFPWWRSTTQSWQLTTTMSRNNESFSNFASG